MQLRKQNFQRDRKNWLLPSQQFYGFFIVQYIDQIHSTVIEYLFYHPTYRELVVPLSNKKISKTQSM